MLRPNLSFLLTTLVMFSAASGQALAQYGPPGGECPPSHYPGMMGSGMACPPPMVDRYSEKSGKHWDDQQPIEHFLGQVVRRSRLRIEYLNWDAKSPGNGKAGARIAGLVDTDRQFEAFDNLNGGQSTGIAELFSHEGLSLDNGSGVRGTLGVALNGAELELSFFGTEQISTESSTGDLVGPLVPPFSLRDPNNPQLGTPNAPNIALPLLTNGVATNTANLNSLIFDDNVRAEMNSQIWGTELALLTDPYLPGSGFQWQWLGGFRYVNLDEDYQFRGVFNDGGQAIDRVTRINSSTVNNSYGPQAGARASLVNKWFTFSVTPRIAMGLNDYTAQVSADPLGTGVVTRTTEDDIEFNTITQLSFTGEFNVTPNFAIYGGYDFLWMPVVSRPHENIRYNSLAGVGGGFTPDVRVNSGLESYSIDGFSVGATFRY